MSFNYLTTVAAAIVMSITVNGEAAEPLPLFNEAELQFNIVTVTVNATESPWPLFLQPTNNNNNNVDSSQELMFTNDKSEAMDVAMTILTVFILSPLIICSNSLLLAAFRRYKRLRTPSNCLVVSLAVSDLGVGLFLPLQVYVELNHHPVQSPILCLLPYCIILILCSVSILNMTAIAIDRYMSLAQPLTYNNIITKTSITRFVAIFWIYSLLLASSPILAFYYTGSSTLVVPMNTKDEANSAHYSVARLMTCSFDMVGNYVRLFLFSMLYAPCALIVLFCYIYVYIVARYHAHAIYSVELSVRQLNNNQLSRASNGNVANGKPTSNNNANHQSNGGNYQPRYGRTLALTVGLFFLLWLPFQIVMLMDVFRDSAILTNTARIYLAFVALSTSAINPWIYGYRNAEFRLAYQKILEELGTKLGVIRSKVEFQKPSGSRDLLVLNSCASNVRLCVSPNHLTMTTLLIPSRNDNLGKDVSSCDNERTTVVICETTVVSTEQLNQQ